MRRGRFWTGERGVARAIALPFLLLIVLTGFAGKQAPPAGEDHDSGSFRISVDVDLVVLHVTVSDRKGGFVSDLREQDFVVYEDGVPQHIRIFRNEDSPVTVGLVVDHSTTMWPKLAEVVAAAQTFVRSSNREDEMFVVNFSEIVSLGLPSTKPFTSDTNELENAIMTASSGGMTALYDAVAKGLEGVQAGSRDKKVLIVVSDGGDNVSVHRREQIMTLAGQSNAIIYTIGIYDETDPTRDLGMLRRLAQTTGGEAFFPEELSDVVNICARIARDIRHQYTIGYIPLNPSRDGAQHAIRVVAGRKGNDRLTVRTRTSYVAAGEPRLVGKGAK